MKHLPINPFVAALTATAVSGFLMPGIATAQTSKASDYAIYRDQQPVWPIHKFDEILEGDTPTALVQGPDGSLYVALKYGSVGSSGGAIFRVTNGAGGQPITVTKLAGFDTVDGDEPIALTFDTAGNLWGITNKGGQFQHGILFKISAGGTYSVMHHFSDLTKVFGTPDIAAGVSGINEEGAYPNSLVLGHDGNLYGTTQFGGPYAEGVVFKVTPGDGTVTRLHAFPYQTTTKSGPTSTQDYTNSDGAEPYLSTIAVGGDGALYGMTSEGGPNGFGTIFRLTTDGTFTRIGDYGNSYSYAIPGGYYFDSEQSNLFSSPDGSVWAAMGMTTIGGGSVSLYGGGKLLRIASGGTKITTPFAFPDPPPFDGFTGKFYPYSADNIAYGCWPTAVAFGPDGSLYGTTTQAGLEGLGTIYKMTANPASPTGISPKSLYNLLGDGSVPSHLIYGNDGLLYGIGRSTLFAVSPTPAPFLLHSFAGTVGDGIDPISLTPGLDGNLYGLTESNSQGIRNSTFFRLTPNSTPENDTFQPLGQLYSIAACTDLFQAPDGKFYGSASFLGPDLQAQGAGGIFRLSAGGAFENFLDFAGAANPQGMYPAGNLIDGKDGYFYGMTSDGGANNVGIIYRLDPVTKNETVLHTFSGNAPEGYQPAGSLVLASNGRLYGTTGRGGYESNSGLGAVFSLDPHNAGANYDFKLLHQFTGTGGDSGNSCGGLVERKGFIYGTFGTNYYAPGVFKIGLDGSNYKVLGLFSGTGQLGAPLVVAPDGSLYGILDGPYNASLDFTQSLFGYIFRVNTDDSISTVHSFHVIDGAAGFGAGIASTGRLMVGPDGSLFGITPSGGINTTLIYNNGLSVLNSNGTVFHLSVGRPAASTAGAIADVSGPVKMAMSNHVLVGGVHRYTYTLTNTGAQSVSGPVYVAFANLAGNQILSADGYTTFALPSGRPFCFVGAGSLAAGGKTTITFRTSKPLVATVQMRVLAGPGGL